MITAHLEQGITFELSGYQKDHDPALEWHSSNFRNRSYSLWSFNLEKHIHIYTSLNGNDLLKLMIIDNSIHSQSELFS